MLILFDNIGVKTKGTKNYDNNKNNKKSKQISQGRKMDWKTPKQDR